jgi:hypothetical protein
VPLRQQEAIARAIEPRGDRWIHELGWPALFIEDLTAEDKSRRLVGGRKVGDGDRLPFPLVTHRTSLALSTN